MELAKKAKAQDLNQLEDKAGLSEAELEAVRGGTKSLAGGLVSGSLEDALAGAVENGFNRSTPGRVILFLVPPKEPTHK
jgi:hypothetical protein